MIDSFPALVRCTHLADTETDPKLHYDNYCRDIQCFQYYGCSYVTYAPHLIDSLCHHVAGHGSKHVAGDLGHSDVHYSEFSRPSLLLSSCQPNMFQLFDDRALISMANSFDFNFPDERDHLVYAEIFFSVHRPR